MQLLPVTKLITVPFASIRKYPNEHPLFTQRRTEVQLKEIRKQAEKDYPKYDISQEYGLHDVVYDEPSGMVALLILIRVQELVTILDTGLDKPQFIG